jgi:hypothetical protein
MKSYISSKRLKKRRKLLKEQRGLLQGARDDIILWEAKGKATRRWEKS